MNRYSEIKTTLKSKFYSKYSKLWRLRSRVKYRNTSFRVSAKEFLSENQEGMFFVLGTGRSGTQLISDLLDNSGQTLVCHEPNFMDDVGLMPDLRSDDSLMLDYWRNYRSYEVYSRWEQSGKKIYGEVNGTIRYHAGAISHLYPNAPIFLLARDPRGTIRSVMPWSFYLADSTGAYNLEPLAGDPWKKEWGNMDRFAKICWSVMDTYRYLLNVIPESRRLRLEDIVTDYSIVKTRLFDVLGVDITEQVWRDIVDKPSRNKSKSYGFPHHSEWNDTQKDTYQKICGPIATKLGYAEEW